MTTNPIDDIFKNLKPLLDEADKITKFAKDIFADLPSAPKFDEAEKCEAEPKIHYKAVGELSLADALILDDGSWQVRSVRADDFDPDLVEVELENSDTHILLRTSLVRVV